MAENSNTQPVELWYDVNRKLDKKRLENSLALSLPKFIEAYGQNMKSKDLEAFNKAVTDVLTSIQNGTVEKRNIARELVFKDGIQRGADDKRMKQAYGLAVNFVNSVIDAMPEYSEPVVQEKPIQQTNNQQQSTNQQKQQQVQQQTQQQANPIDAINQKLQRIQQSKLEALTNKITNWNVTGNPILMQLPNSNYNEDFVMKAYKKMNLGNGYANLFRNKIAPEFFRDLNTIVSPEKLSNRDIQIKNQFGHMMSAKQHIVNTLDFFIQHPDLVPNNGEFNVVSGGKVTIPGSFNEDTGTILLYDPAKKVISRESIVNTPELWNHFQVSRGLIAPPQQQQMSDDMVSNHKNGGELNIKKFEYGGQAVYTLTNRDYLTDQQLNDYINKYQTQADLLKQEKLDRAKTIQQQKLEAVQNEAKAKGRSVQAQQNLTKSLGDKKELSGTDITRLASAAGDLAAVAAAFVPGAGQVASIGLGATSTLANLGADIADGENLGTALSTAGINLGLDFAGMIPGAGATGKFAKVSKTLLKYTPWILAAMNASNLGEEVKSFKKLITSPTSVTAEDLQNVASGLSLVLGIKHGVSSARARSKALQKDLTGVVTDSGKVAILKKSELENIKGNQALQDRINKIKGFEGEKVSGIINSENPNWKNLWGRTEKKVKTIDVYNFSNPTNNPYINMLEHRAKGYLPLRGDKYNYTVKATMPVERPLVAVTNEPYSPTYNMGVDPTTGHNVVYRKSGGIIKAQQGTILWPKVIDPNTYTTTWGNTLHGVNADNTYVDQFKYGNNGIGSIKERYKTDPRFSNYTQTGQNYAKNIEAQQKYIDFTTNLLNSYDEYASSPEKYSNNNNLFYKWSQMYDKSLPTGSLSTLFENGKLRGAWNIKNKDAYGRETIKQYTNPREYLEHLRYDNLLANAHNDLLKEGNRYFYTENGQRHYVSEADAAKFKQEARGSVIDGITKWNDFEIFKNGPETTLGEGPLPNQNPSKQDYMNTPEGSRLKANLSEAARAWQITNQNLNRLKKINNFQPYQLEHPVYERQTTDMTNVLKSAYENGNREMSSMNVPRYADASLNEAMKREKASDVRAQEMQAENQNAQYINQQRDANDKIAMTNENARIDTANNNRKLAYAADEEKRINTMKIDAANTDIWNNYWMKQNYDLEQKAQKQENLQNWWNSQQVGSVEQEQAKLLSTNDEYQKVRKELLTLYSQGVSPNDPRMVDAQNRQAQIMSTIYNQARENYINRVQQIYGVRRAIPTVSTPTYHAQIASGANGMTIKIKNQDQIERAKLRARSKDNDRFVKQLNKTVDSFLSQDKQLGKTLLDKITKLK